MTLYASVLRLDRAAVKALRVTDLYSLHRVVYALFEDVRSEMRKQASVPSGIQWVDKGGDHRCRQILLLSDRLPQAGEYGEVESRPLPDDFLSHRHYRFAVTVSPTRRDNQSRQLKPVKGREAIADWFIERAATNWGFYIDSERIQVDDVRVAQFKGKAERAITLQQATLSGYLTVTDPERFALSVASGVGRGRAFGCGLLQVVPLIEHPLF
ncbi:type I-E CRISPR-associated protein Cas6/Cse3/CasE [Edwardsiella piscicida]|uniref:type I-E CRISPR-associated protein Cas6/Cse3/CasE n=1 Tax=Edwardsiella piscicida TaxID=1263550 RepID=UPI00084C9187|nr:type I-E CRISPR-associated protein Cas6/Cse3/CasE [Edwardsiella piscicida]AOP43748.1 type I-E CRISPR-associated protein Cas6/Cse3/CasE [Edwardsiella piscicida]EKS7766566.1 type I-E CRISPR-associated protein Cas6/Cse3/CasE [Edwardsiella piscicida]EKS7812971.1 type I-E CRISPR-associated protein Cas6/Cse3/CasE [Edwardsiella piscicida]ELM3723124.1 type I-E CRISPR-associated protein Cas6/Cse3/CasE [Edwardsiella piscicida]UCQ20215.1 type I-E CRISPR-associated protein Cas6/Cse3/CasE [Edwardsiella 